MLRLGIYYSIIFFFIQVFKANLAIALFYYTPCEYKRNVYLEVPGDYLVFPWIYLGATLILWVIMLFYEELRHSLYFLVNKTVVVEAHLVTYIISTGLIVLATFISSNNLIGTVALLPMFLWEVLALPLLVIYHNYYLKN